MLSTWIHQKILLPPWIFQKYTTSKWHLLNTYQQRYQLKHIPEVTFYRLVYTRRNVSTYTYTHNKKHHHVCTISYMLQTRIYHITHQFEHTPMVTLPICIYHKTCYQLVCISNVYIPEYVHQITGNTSTRAYQNWHISTRIIQQKVNILNFRVSDVTELLNHIYKKRHVTQLTNTRTDMSQTCIYYGHAIVYSHSQL